MKKFGVFLIENGQPTKEIKNQFEQLYTIFNYSYGGYDKDGIIYFDEDVIRKKNPTDEEYNKVIKLIKEVNANKVFISGYKIVVLPHEKFIKHSSRITFLNVNSHEELDSYFGNKNDENPYKNIDLEKFFLYFFIWFGIILYSGLF